MSDYLGRAEKLAGQLLDPTHEAEIAKRMWFAAIVYALLALVHAVRKLE